MEDMPYNKIPTHHSAVKIVGAACMMLVGSFIATPVAQAATPITTCAELQGIDNNLSGSYVLANNINCEDSWSAGFNPIGTVGSPFTGTLDGQGYIIDDPYIGGIASYTGLFTATGPNAVIKNLGITRASITGGSYTGALVGYHYGTIQNVYVEGSVTTTVSYAGGLVGYSNGGDIINSYSHASVTALTAYAGGLVGLNGNAATIQNSYVTGAMSGFGAAGIVGNNGSGTVTDSFWDTQTTGVASSSTGGTGKTTAEMKTQSTFTNWDFDTVWVIASGVNSGYPYLDTNLPTVTNVTSTTADGLYGLGQVINITVTFSKAVTSTGDVTVTLETGTTDRTCTFTVSAATTGTCNYTVQAGDATDDLTVNTVTGTIKDSVAHTLTNTTPVTNLAANKTLIIETTSPTVTLATNDVTQGGDISTRALTFTASLSESSSGFTVEDIAAINATVDGFTETTTAQQYSFTVHPTATGAVTLDIAAGAAQDAAGNPSVAATQYAFTYTNIPLVESVSVDKGTITIIYDDGTTKQFTPFQDNYIHHYVISYDDRHVVVVGAGVMKIYTTGVLTTTHRFSEQALAKSDTAVASKRLYNTYETVVVATPSKMIVWRLTAAGKLTKKKVVNFTNPSGNTPTISFNKKKKHIQLTLSKKLEYRWKLLASGKLRLIK